MRVGLILILLTFGFGCANEQNLKRIPSQNQNINENPEPPDTTPPTITISTPAAGSLINRAQQSAVRFSGTCSEEGLSVSILLFASSVETNCLNHTWSTVLDLTSLSDGNLTARAQHRDAANNFSETTVQFNKDATPPNVQFVSPSSNASFGSAPFNLQLNCEANRQVSLSGDISAADQTPFTCPASGGVTRSITLTGLSTDNGVAKNVIISQSDAANNPAQVQRTFLRDVVSTLTIATPQENFQVNIAQIQSPVRFSGSCSDAGTNNVTLTGGNLPVSVDCSAAHQWQADLFFSAVAEGNITVTVRHTDAASNSSQILRHGIRDTIPPNVAITAPAAFTKTQGTFSITVVCESAAGASNVTVTGDFTGSPRSVACPANGTFQTAVTFTGPNGVRNINVSQSDAFQNLRQTPDTSYVLSVCPGQGSTAVDASYQNSDSGAYCLVRNELNGHYNFSTGLANYIPIADPSIMKLGAYYYVTGTSDSHSTGNFPIYRSSNLVDWQLFKMAFDENLRNSGNLRFSSALTFCNMWAPHLYQNPADPNTVYLSFSSTIDTTANASVCAALGSEHYETPSLSKISTTNFLGAGYFSTPEKFFYQVNNNSAAVRQYDGGLAQGTPIPVSIDWPNGPNMIMRNWRPCFGGSVSNCDTSMAIDPYVFYDSSNGNKRWMVFTWQDGANNSGLPYWAGNHVAAFPMVQNSLAQIDALAGFAQFLPFAYRHNTNAETLVGSTYNGCYGRLGAGQLQNACVAEAPAVSKVGNYYYLTYSHNGWDSPAYGSFYRKASTFEGLSLPNRNFGTENAESHALITSVNRTVPCGESFGHGEIFIGPNNKPYFIFHRKEAETACVQGAYNFPHGFSGRTIYFKELTVNADGSLQSISNTSANGLARDARSFIIPRP